MSDFLSYTYVCELNKSIYAVLPYLKGVKYICVPWAWMTIIASDKDNGDMASFRYPDEEPVKTKKRIMNEEQFDPTWKSCVANVFTLGEVPYDVAVQIVDSLESLRRGIVTAAQAAPPVASITKGNIVKNTRDGVCAATENTQNQATTVQILHRSVLNHGSNHPSPGTKQSNVPKKQVIDLEVMEEILKRQRSNMDFMENFFEDAKYYDGLMTGSIGCVVAPKMTYMPKAPPIRKRSSSFGKNTDETPSKRKREKQPLKLPHKFDPIATEWTLRHRNKTADLRELVRDQGIYVNAKDYITCTSIAKNNSQLIYMLLAMIFNEKALKVCSITGRVPRGQMSRALDQKALRVIAMFVRDFVRCKPNTWPNPVPTEDTINSVIRHSLKRFKRIYFNPKGEDKPCNTRAGQ